MGKSVDYEMVTKGVETKQQARFLADGHTNQLQGYLFNKSLLVISVGQRFFNSATPLKNIKNNLPINY